MNGAPCRASDTLDDPLKEVRRLQKKLKTVKTGYDKSCHSAEEAASNVSLFHVIHKTAMRFLSAPSPSRLLLACMHRLQSGGPGCQHCARGILLSASPLLCTNGLQRSILRCWHTCLLQCGRLHCRQAVPKNAPGCISSSGEATITNQLDIVLDGVQMVDVLQDLHKMKTIGREQLKVTGRPN